MTLKKVMKKNNILISILFIIVVFLMVIYINKSNNIDDSLISYPIENCYKTYTV